MKKKKKLGPIALRQAELNSWRKNNKTLFGVPQVHQDERQYQKTSVPLNSRMGIKG